MEIAVDTPAKAVAYAWNMLDSATVSFQKRILPPLPSYPPTTRTLVMAQPNEVFAQHETGHAHPRAHNHPHNA